MAQMECNYENKLPQSLLRVSKKLIDDPAKVTARFQLERVEDFKQFEQAYYQTVEVSEICGGTGTIQGKVLMKQVVLVGGVYFSVILEQDGKIAYQNIYDGKDKGVTVYEVYKTVAFDTDVSVEQDKIKPVFSKPILKHEPQSDEVEFYVFIVDGTVSLEVEEP